MCYRGIMCVLQHSWMGVVCPKHTLRDEERRLRRALHHCHDTAPPRARLAGCAPASPLGYPVNTLLLRGMHVEGWLRSN